ncbi:hypothetical protein VIGAN_11102800 [Vigna angularis var. angularis]|uniref:Uncharacterized protein n=1 Tax=Vigna angularis var. angularis TaxID=157739 RepID=A0A0S3T9T3_PHAAN|nr:hypothetical protein VIGAN_11102800 [Vigna angularis var. angularis]
MRNNKGSTQRWVNHITSKQEATNQSSPSQSSPSPPLDLDMKAYKDELKRLKVMVESMKVAAMLLVAGFVEAIVATEKAAAVRPEEAVGAVLAEEIAAAVVAATEVVAAAYEEVAVVVATVEDAVVVIASAGVVSAFVAAADWTIET